MRQALIFIVLLMMPGPAHADTRLECELLGIGLEMSPGSDATKPIYIATQTETEMLRDVTFEYLAREMKSLKIETFDSFTANNRASVAVDCARLRPAGRDVVLTDDELPRGSTRYSISRAGLSQDQGQALLYEGYFCGPLCGGGSLYLFERKGGKWTLAGQSMVWIS
jgi:hypothetical protein